MHLRLLEFCRCREITLSELSRWTGIARVSLSRYAHGAQDITLGQLFKIASSLGCSLGELVDDREDLATPAWRKAIRKRSSDRAHKKDKSWVPRVLLAARLVSRGTPYEKA
jgi:DNA-binding Xre family transcriptional regulator